MIAASTRPDIGDRGISRLVADFGRRAFADEVLGAISVDVALVDLFTHRPVIGDLACGPARCAAAVGERPAEKPAEQAKTQATRVAGLIRRGRRRAQSSEFATIQRLHPEQGQP